MTCEPGRARSRVRRFRSPLVFRARAGRVLTEQVAERFWETSGSQPERISDDRPLRLTEQAENLAEIVHEAGDDEPPGLARRTDRFGGLEGVLDMREIDVRIAGRPRR